MPDVHRPRDLGRVARRVVAVPLEDADLARRTPRAEMNGTFHPSAWRAAMRSVTFSPPPPIQSGSRSCTGFGSHRASVSVKNSPSKLVTSWVSRPRTHWIASSTWRSRTADRRELDAVGVVLVGQPAAAEPERDPAVGELVERGHRVGEHRRVPVPDGVDEAAAAHA